MPESARAAMLLLKLDIVSFLHYAWREVHNKMLLRSSIALDCLERTLTPIDEDQKLALLHAPFKGTTLFGRELAKLQEANTKRAATFTVFPQPTAPSTSYSACPYVGHGKSFKDKKGFKKPGGRGRGQGRSAPSATITRPGQSKDGQKALTVSVTLRNVKLRHRMMPLKVLEKPSVIFEEIKARVINNEGVLPPQVSPVGGRLSNFVEGWKRIMNDPYILSIVAKGYRLRFTSPPLLRQTPWEIRSLQDPLEILAIREQISLMLQKNAITEVLPGSPGFYSNQFLVRKASGGWRPVIDLKNLNAHIHAPHFRMFTTSSVLSSVEKGDYVFKIDLQDAYFHAPIHPSSRKYLRFAFVKQGVPVSSTAVRSKHSPSSFYSFGAYGDSIPAPSGDLGDTISGRLVNSPPGPSSFITTSG